MASAESLIKVIISNIFYLVLMAHQSKPYCTVQYATL